MPAAALYEYKCVCALTSLSWALCQAGERRQVNQGHHVLHLTWPDCMSQKLSTGLQVRLLCMANFVCVWVYVAWAQSWMCMRTHEGECTQCCSPLIQLHSYMQRPQWQHLPEKHKWWVTILCTAFFPFVTCMSHLAALTRMHTIMEAGSLVWAHPTLQVKGAGVLLGTWCCSTHPWRWTRGWSQGVYSSRHNSRKKTVL